MRTNFHAHLKCWHITIDSKVTFFCISKLYIRNLLIEFILEAWQIVSFLWFYCWFQAIKQGKKPLQIFRVGLSISSNENNGEIERDEEKKRQQQFKFVSNKQNESNRIESFDKKMSKDSNQTTLLSMFQARRNKVLIRFSRIRHYN